MLGYQKLKRQLLPLLKGAPFILGMFLVALYVAKKIIDYTPNTYQSIAKIKLDDQKYGFSNNNLFADFDIFSTENKIEAEAEILQSPLIVGKALETVDFDVVIYRVGSIKNTMLYDDAPVQISYSVSDDKFFKYTYLLEVSDDHLEVKEGDETETSFSGSFGEEIKLTYGTLTVNRNEFQINHGVDLNGAYQIKIFSKERLIEDVISRLNITAIDKEIAVLRVVYTDEHPQKVADLVNALCEAYINDYVETKSQAAKQTEAFINEKLEEVGGQLSSAEDNIENFKVEHNVVNTLQETETGLREISKLNVSLINLEMNEKAILQLKKYLDSGEYFDETAIAFGFGDLLMTELVKKLKYWQDEKRDLLLKYQPSNQKITNIDDKIEEIKKYVVVAINQNLAEIEAKRIEIDAVLQQESKMFDSLPAREKKQHILERNFDLLENVYKFLSQKKIEASIAGSAQHSFHRVIEKGKVPTDPISPNRTLIKFVFGLLGLILSIAVVYLRSLLKGKVKSKEDVENNTTLDFLGVIRKNKVQEDASSLLLALDLKQKLPQKGVVAIVSTIKGEGKTHFSAAFCKELKGAGINSTVYAPGLDHGTNQKEISQLKESYELVVLDCPATASDIAGVYFMKNADLSIYLLRSDYTPNTLVNHAELLVNEYEIKNVHLVLNGAHKAINYSGNLIGSRFSRETKSGWLNRVINYVQTYVLG